MEIYGNKILTNFQYSNDLKPFNQKPQQMLNIASSATRHWISSLTGSPQSIWKCSQVFHIEYSNKPSARSRAMSSSSLTSLLVIPSICANTTVCFTKPPSILSARAHVASIKTFQKCEKSSGVQIQIWSSRQPVNRIKSFRGYSHDTLSPPGWHAQVFHAEQNCVLN